MSETIGQRLRELRERKVWTQMDLAARAGVSYVTISRIENGYGDGLPRPSTIQKLAAALGVTPEYLVFGADAKTAT